MATGHFEQECLLERLHHYAPVVTQTTQRVWRIAKQLHMNITVPKSETQDWVSMEASSARAKDVQSLVRVLALVGLFK